MKSILVTGCAGFIGSHVSEKLLKMGYKVIGIDNFSKFYDKKIKQRNLEPLIANPNFQFKELDIRNKDALFKEINEAVDIVVHLAAKAGVRPSILDPEAYIDVNIKGTHHLLQWMQEYHCKKLFFASSSSVYGNSMSDEAFIENEKDVKPISPYAFTKRSAELMNHTYHHLYHFDIINARFFTVYGPRQRPDLAIHKFVKLIDNNSPIEMYGDGSTARDYTYIDDTVDGILKGINYLLQNEGVYETINLGNQTPVPLKQLIDLIYKEMGQEPTIKQLPMQDGDVNITHANIDKAKQLLNYQPKTDMKTGLKKFVAWYFEEKNRRI